MVKVRPLFGMEGDKGEQACLVPGPAALMSIASSSVCTASCRVMAETRPPPLRPAATRAAPALPAIPPAGTSSARGSLAHRLQ